MEWTDQGVALRAPVRGAEALRAVFVALLTLALVSTFLWLTAVGKPPDAVGFEQCLVQDARSSALCESIRPSWMTWSFPTLATYTRARSCTVDADAFALTRLSHVLPSRGVDHSGNITFLQMIGAQGGACSLPIAESLVVQREYQALTALEDAVWAARVEHAVASERWWLDVRGSWHATGRRFLPLWMPALLLGWMFLLVGLRRLARAAEPFTLRVTRFGVHLDGQFHPGRTIAFLRVEGQCLHIERWSGPAIRSRPLPPEALAHADEICGIAVHWADEPRPTVGDGEARRRLEAMRRTA